MFRTETLQDTDYNEIVSCLRSGGVIGFPTDTAYGLGADPYNEAAIHRIFAIKGRAETKPLLVIVDSLAMAESVSAQLPQTFYDVVKKFWPGALTLIVRSEKSVPRQLTAGTKTIGIRWPIAPYATMLVQRFGKPITATSANQTGMPAPITAGEVRAQLGASLDMLIDGGTLPARSGSTVLDLTVEPALVLREGPITFQSLYEFFEGNIRSNVA